MSINNFASVIQVHVQERLKDLKISKRPLNRKQAIRFNAAAITVQRLQKDFARAQR